MTASNRVDEIAGADGQSGVDLQPSAQVGTQLAARTLPGPRLPALLQTLLLMRPLGPRLDDPVPWGDRFRIELWAPRARADETRMPLVRATIVVVSAPEDLRAVFTASADDLSTGDARGFVEWWVGSDSILVLDGDDHRRERALLHQLLAPERLDRYDDIAVACATATLRDLPASGRVPLGPLLDDMVLHVSVQLLLGQDDPCTTRRLGDFVRHTIDAPLWAAPAMFLPFLRRPSSMWGAVRRAASAERDYRAILAGNIEQRLQGGAALNGLQPHLLAHLLQLEAREPDDAGTAAPPLAPVLAARRMARVGTLFGGIDTLCASLRWCLLHLLATPKVLRAAAEEARSASELRVECLPYLEAVCKEALRIHPPFPIAIRRVRRDANIGELAFERGMYIAPAILLAHRREETYPDPHAFRPERFLERNFSPWEYLPFGGGQRRCLGHALALRQMIVLLAVLLRELELRPAPPYDNAARRRSIMFVPRDPLKVEYRRIGGAC